MLHYVDKGLLQDPIQGKCTSMVNTFRRQVGGHVLDWNATLLREIPA